MGMHMENVQHSRVKMRRKSLCKPSAEYLFGKRFSGLTIDDEYNYNLEYLISQNGHTKWISNSNKTSKQSVVDTKVNLKTHTKDSNISHNAVRETTNENYHTRLNCFESPNNKYAIKLEKSIRHPEPKTVLADSTLSENGTICIQDIEAAKSFYKYNHFKCDGNVPMERPKSSQKAAIAGNQATQSVIPGLHIYVTESPPNCYYDALKPLESISQQVCQKTMTYNTLSLAHQSSTRAKNIVCSIPQREEIESKNHKRDRDSIRKSLEEIEHTSVASRIEAFMALLKPQEPKKYTNDNHPVRHASSYHKNRIASPIEGCTERPYVRFQRAATINYGKSGSVALPQMAEYCFTCCKRIYPVDRVSIGDRVYHKGCFRCATCQRIVLPGNFASLDGIILCKPHYIEQFRLSGNKSGELEVSVDERAVCLDNNVDTSSGLSLSMRRILTTPTNSAKYWSRKNPTGHSIIRAY